MSALRERHSDTAPIKKSGPAAASKDTAHRVFLRIRRDHARVVALRVHALVIVREERRLHRELADPVASRRVALDLQHTNASFAVVVLNNVHRHSSWGEGVR